MSTLSSTYLKNASSISNNIELDTSGNIALQAGTAAAPALQPTGDSNTGLLFPAADTVAVSTGGSERARIDSSGYLRLAGAGIQFNGDTAAANSLDDYEEGTFTPTVIGSGAAGTATYIVQAGRYTKVGRLVQFEIYLFWSGGTGTNDLRVAGLPFTANNGSTFPAVTVAGANNLANTASNYINAYIQDGTSTIYIMQYPTGGGTRTTVGYDAAGEILLSGTYSI